MKILCKYEKLTDYSVIKQLFQQIEDNELSRNMFIGFNYKALQLNLDLKIIHADIPNKLTEEIKETYKLLAFYNKYRKHLYGSMIRNKYIII